MKSQLPLNDGARRGSADSVVIGFHSWSFVHCKESVDANSGLFKETDDVALSKTPYEIRFCDWISASPGHESPVISAL